MAADDVANLEAALRLPWLQDDVTEIEYDIIDSLVTRAFDATDVVSQLLSMPFLLSSGATDALAIRGMRDLADEGRLAALTGHPVFQDGITEEETTLIAAVGTLRDADEIQRVLDPGGAAIETVSLDTELTPQLKISIVRTESQSRPGTIEATRDLIQFIENTMGLPLPVDHVIIMLSENAVPDYAGGANFGFSFSYLPEYEVAQQGTHKWRQSRLGFVHETAHYFWRGNEGWIDEGLANIVEYQFGLQMGLSHGQLQTKRKNCEAHDLEMLSEWDPGPGDHGYYCSYYLGQLLFQDLLASMGAETFTLSLQEYYRLSLEAQKARRSPGIVEVRKAFAGQDAIIDRHWSGKMNSPENRPFDEGYEYTSHALIRWTQLPTYDAGSNSVSFEGALLGDAVLVDDTPKPLSFVLYSADDGEFSGFILPVLEGQTWNLKYPGDTVATRYLVNPETRSFSIEFPFPQKLGGVPSDYAVRVRGFQDSSRIPTIGEKRDTLGYARIRIPSTPVATATSTAVPVYTAAWNRLDNAAWLEANHPSLAVEIKDLSWVKDGINDAESKALREILYLATLSHPAVANVLEMRWVRDGVDDEEAESLDFVVGFNDPAVALSITKLSWIQDGIDEPSEVRVIRELYSYFNDGDPRLAASVIGLEWVGDDITELEADALDWLNGFRDSRVALMLVEQTWMQDGIDEPLEVLAIRELSYFDYGDPRLATSMTFDSGRPDLYETVSVPEHMAAIWWEWDQIEEAEELAVSVTIHNDVELRGRDGLYLILGNGSISDVGYYFGIQTDVYSPVPPHSRGKGLIFSRWKTRDLTNARIPDDGWLQSSGHEGDFIGVRRSYAWGAGEYRVRIAPDGPLEDDGVWFGLWITELRSGVTTWIGSLKFPLLDGKGVITATSYSTMEIYGHSQIRPIDIPRWHVSIERPTMDGAPSRRGVTEYSGFHGQIVNSDVWYDPEDDVVHIVAGGMTERTTESQTILFDRN